MVESQSVRVFLGCGTRHIGALWADGWLTAFVGDTTMLSSSMVHCLGPGRVVWEMSVEGWLT